MKPVRLNELPVADTHGAFGHTLPEAANGPIVTQTTAPRGWLARIDAGLGRLVEVPAGLLVVADIVVLLAGVVARFVFHQPRSSGPTSSRRSCSCGSRCSAAVVAQRRGEHMRMTAIVARLEPERAAR